MARSDRRHLVTVQGPGAGSIVDGDWVPGTPTPLDPPTWWCSINPASQRVLERVAAGTVIAEASHVVEGDYHPGINTQTQLVFEGRTLYVKGVSDPEERHITTIALCSEVAT